MKEETWVGHVAVGLVLSGSAVLVGRRPPGAHLEGLCEFPGGKREPDEDIRSALDRELREEVGIELEEALPLPPGLRYDYEDRSVLLFPFFCRVRESSVQGPLPEPWRWVPLAELPALDFPPANAPLLRFLART